LAALLLGTLAVAPTARAENNALRRHLGEARIYFEAGNLRAAKQSFEAALQQPRGLSSAEVHYGLSLIPWKRGQVRRSYGLLERARAASKEVGWDGGEDGEWDRRIAGRIRYVERNFAAVTLRHPTGGKALAPLLDPPPRDPLLRRFAAATEAQIQAGSVGSDGAQRLFLPSGRYWIGDNYVDLVAGDLASGKQQILYLPLARGPVLKRYQERLRMQAEGLPIAAPSPAVGSAAVTEAAPPAAAEGAAGVAPDPLEYPVVRSYLSGNIAEDVSARWTAVPFQAQYSVYCPDGDTEHQFNFPDYGFYVRFDPGGELRVKGAEMLRVGLGSDWLVGDPENPNQVELRFDGKALVVVANGMEFGPVQVCDERPQRPGRWQIRLSDDRARITYLSIHPLN
jgi:hypothetical protein